MPFLTGQPGRIFVAFALYRKVSVHILTEVTSDFPQPFQTCVAIVL